jgi:AbrB family looped-hinge helix DNA binding protein
MKMVVMNTSTMSEKGWIVIPREMRERYGLKKGHKVHVIDYGGVISLVPISESPINNSWGMLKGKTSLVKELLESRLEDAERSK